MYAVVLSWIIFVWKLEWSEFWREKTHTHAHARKYTDRCEEPHKNGKYYTVFVDRLLDKANFRRLKHLCNVIRRKRQKHKRSKPLFSLITLIDWGYINAKRRICWQYTVFLCTHNCFNNKNTRNWFLFPDISFLLLLPITHSYTCVCFRWQWQCQSYSIWQQRATDWWKPIDGAVCSCAIIQFIFFFQRNENSFRTYLNHWILWVRKSNVTGKKPKTDSKLNQNLNKTLQQFHIDFKSPWSSWSEKAIELLYQDADSKIDQNTKKRLFFLLKYKFKGLLKMHPNHT